MKKISFKEYQGLIIHEDALRDNHFTNFIKNLNINKIIFYKSKKIKGFDDIEKLELPASIDQINKIVMNNIVKKEYKTNSSLKINHYKLDKNTRRLMKNGIELELTEKEIGLIELLNKKSFTKKKEILSEIWKYSDNADTHTLETHIYRLRKKIKDTFNDQDFIKSEKKVILFEKRNKFAKDLMTSKYRSRIVKPKKGKGSFKRKKKFISQN